MNQPVDHTDHTDVAAYAFGALDEQQRRAFEVHLATCPTCPAELAEFRGMTGMFAALKRTTSIGPPVQTAHVAADEPGDVIELIRQRKRQVKRYRRGTALLTAAAAVVILAVGVMIGSSTGGHQPPVAGPGSRSPVPSVNLPETGETHSATNPRNGVTATVALAKHGWGTEVALRMSNLKGPLECDLVAVAKNGTERVVSGWSVPPAGYGTPAHHEPLSTQGGTSIPVSGLARFDVRVVGGGTLISVPI